MRPEQTGRCSPAERKFNSCIQDLLSSLTIKGVCLFPGANIPTIHSDHRMNEQVLILFSISKLLQNKQDKAKC